MSLAIQAEQVKRVLLADGKWYDVAAGSFELDAYEYLSDELAVFKGGQNHETIPSTGAAWTGPHSERFFCPLTSVLAVRY